jgi:hypothetical protein
MTAELPGGSISLAVTDRRAFLSGLLKVDRFFRMAAVKMKKYFSVISLVLAMTLLQMRAGGSAGEILLTTDAVPLGGAAASPAGDAEHLALADYQRGWAGDVRYTVVFQPSSNQYLVYDGFIFIGYLPLGETESIEDVRWDTLPERIMKPGGF